MARKVIIAEDDEQIRSFLASYMGEVKGLDIEVCENGEQLLEKIANTRYDLILTDNDMPRIRGVEAIKRIRESDKDILIYLMSGQAAEEDALQAGANGYLHKPFNIRDLDGIVEVLNPTQQDSQPDYEQQNSSD